MFFSIISSILSASEELRLTFPLTKTGSSKENEEKSHEGTTKNSDEKQKDEKDLETAQNIREQ